MLLNEQVVDDLSEIDLYNDEMPEVDDRKLDFEYVIAIDDWIANQFGKDLKKAIELSKYDKDAKVYKCYFKYPEDHFELSEYIKYEPVDINEALKPELEESTHPTEAQPEVDMKAAANKAIAKAKEENKPVIYGYYSSDKHGNYRYYEIDMISCDDLDKCRDEVIAKYHPAGSILVAYPDNDLIEQLREAWDEADPNAECDICFGLFPKEKCVCLKGYKFLCPECASKVRANEALDLVDDDDEDLFSDRSTEECFACGDVMSSENGKFIGGRFFCKDCIEKGLAD